MKLWISLVLSIGMGIGLQAQDQFFVDADNQTGVEDGSMLHPFDTISEAIDWVAEGDSCAISVAAGTYTENLLVVTKTISLQGGFVGGDPEDYENGIGGDFEDSDPDGNVTTIQGDGTDSVISLIESGNSLVDGFHITGGTGSRLYLPDFYAGGGILCDGGSPTMSHNVIEGNDTRHPGSEAGFESWGGGIFSGWSDSTIADNIIRDNFAGYGAGIRVVGGDVVIRGNTVQGNIAVNDHGGGMHIMAQVSEITQNHILENQIGFDLEWGHGAGIIVAGAGNRATLSYNIVEANFAKAYGAGEFIDEGAVAVLDHELIIDNRGAAGGGEGGGTGIYVDGGTDDEGNAVGSQVTIRSSTVVGNVSTGNSFGFGLAVTEMSSATVVDSIFWNNGSDDFFSDASSSIQVTYSNSEEAHPGTGNLSMDPAFVDPINGDYHLKSRAGSWRDTQFWTRDDAHSPLIDAGDPESDFGEEPIPNGSRINMGVFGNTAHASKSGNDVPEPAEPLVWESRGIGAGGALFSASISPHDPNLLFMATDMSSAFQSEDFGKSWETIPFAELWGGENTHIRFTSDPHILYTINRLSLPQGSDWRTPSKSGDGGQSWRPLTSDPTYHETYYLFADLNATQRVLISDYDTLYYSTDGGDTFSAVYSGRADSLHVAGAFFDGQNIYVGTEDGLVVSTDNGTTFSLWDLQGIPSTQAIVSFCGAMEDETTRFFAVTLGEGDVYPTVAGWDAREYKGTYTIDVGQASWTPVAQSLPDHIDFFYVDMPSGDISVAYAAGSNTDLAVPVVYKTEDGGASWRSVFLTENNQNIATGWCGHLGDLRWWYPEFVLDLAVCPTDPDRVLVTDLGFVHVSDDGGDRWRQAYVNPSDENPAGNATPTGLSYQGVGVENTSVWWLHWMDESNLFAAFTDIRGIRSSDGGKTWTSGFSLGLPHNTTYHVVQHPTTGTLYGATSSVHDIYEPRPSQISDARLDAGQGSVIYSTDAGRTWLTLTDFGHPVIWLALDPQNPNTLYASAIDSHEGDIYVTHDLDAGTSASWQRLSSPPRTEGHPFNIHVLDDGTLLATYSARMDNSERFTPSSGVFISSNGGTSWQDRSHTNMHRWAKDVVIDPHDPSQNTWYVAVFGHWGTAPIDVGGLYRTRDRGVSWSRISNLARVESCSIHPQKANTAYLSTETQGLWRTDNLNDPTPTFSQVQDYPFKQPIRVFFNPFDPDELWTTSYGGGLRVNRTTEDEHVRWMPHLTRIGGLFETRLTLTNIDSSPDSIILKPFDQDGEPMNTVTVELAGAQFASYGVQELFQSDRVSHFSIGGSNSISVTAAYRLASQNGATAHVNETTLSGTEFVLYPGEWETVFDGMALVNVSPRTAQAEITQFTGMTKGQFGHRKILDIAPKAKSLFVFGDEFEAQPESQIHVTTTQPCCVLFLRGTYPSVSPGYLYQTLPITPGTADPERWVAHVTPPNAAFKTFLNVSNFGAESATIQIHPFDLQGRALADISLGVNGNHFQIMPTSEAFPDLAVSHFRIDAPDTCNVSVGYRIASGLGATAHVNEVSFKSHQADEPFVLYQGEWDRVFDGMALVNLGSENATIRARQVDAQGNQTLLQELTQTLVPKGKYLVVFDDVFRDAPHEQIQITSDQPSIALFLRGTPPGVAPGYLYQTQGVPSAR